MKDPAFAKFVVLVNGAVPLAVLSWDGVNNQLGADPENRALHVTGMTALILLMLTLAITPVRKFMGWNWLSHFRRMLGLYSFFYATAHFLIYFAADRNFSVASTIREIVARKFIFFGMTALLLMVPLAATSTNGIIKRMGAARWKRLHRLIYPAAIAAVVHFVLVGKLGTFKALLDPSHWQQELFVAVVGILLGYRLFTAARKPPPVAR